jgi:hypothetical protein
LIQFALHWAAIAAAFEVGAREEMAGNYRVTMNRLG